MKNKRNQAQAAGKPVAVGKTAPKKQDARKSGGTFFEQLDAFIDRHFQKIFWVLFGVAMLMAVLMFDIRFSLTGDDSAYVIRAYDFIKNFTYPGFQGPLYPIVLSPVVALFGINPLPLKSLSVLFLAGFIYISYRSFRGRIPATVALATLVLTGIDVFVLHFASQTYSEMFFMMLQAVLMLAVFRWFIDVREVRPLAGEFRLHLVVAGCILSLVLTRSIGISAALAVPLWFLSGLRWRDALLSVVAIAAVFALWQGIRYLAWGGAGFQLADQGNGLLNKDYYKPALGREDLAGYIHRFLHNSDSYLSRHFVSMLGLRSMDVTIGPVWWITAAIGGIFLAGLVVSYRRNRYLFFAGFYSLIFLAISFVVLQTTWDQTRIIIPFLLYILLMLFAALYYLLSVKQLRRFQWIFPVVFIVLAGFSLSATSKVMQTVRKIDGPYYGLSPDWENYARISKWASDNLPDSAVVACRKPTISFMFGPKCRFFGISQLPNYPIEDLLTNWKSQGLKYVIFDYDDAVNINVSAELFAVVRNSLVAQINREGESHYVLNLPDSIRPAVEAEMTKNGIVHRADADSARILYSKTKGFYAIYPDSLLEILRKNRVTHILIANLRGHPERKSADIINTVERFAGIIANKYPKSLVKVAQMGDDNNEPASLYRVDYPSFPNGK